jgi:Ca-activated chloride channel family protein
MVRPFAALALVLALVGLAGSARASGSSSRLMGMYPATTGATTPPPLPMVESKIDVIVRGPIVETVVTQRFTNRSDRAIEATYIFPLPLDAAVTAMSIKTGTRTIKAAIEKREEAQRRYEEAVSAGVSAAVLDQERPDVFTQTVTAIPAKGTVEIVLRYDALARYASGTWQLVLPMVVAPRYVPGTISGRPTTGTGRSPDTDRAPDASRVTPSTGPQAGGATHVAIHFAEPVTAVTSPTHELADAKAPDVSFTDPHSDHDAVIRWTAKVPAAGWVEQGARGGYAAVIVEAPPSAPARKGALRMLLVLDRAATMQGDANVTAQPIVRALFGALTPADRIAVLGADKSTWSPPADALRGVEAAWQRSGGALDLSRVLATARPDGAPIIVVSDGLVADDAAVLAAGKKLGVPIHVIGVGPAPARALLTQLAASTGGTVRFVVPADDLAAIAKSAVLDVASPAQPLTVTWGTLAASDVVPGILPRLGAGQAILVLARVKRAQTANARARGELFAIDTLTASPALAGATSTAGPLARRWARIRLDELLVGKRDEAAVTKHALEFGLVSPYTSFVAVGTDVVVRGGTKHSVAVPVSVPSGMDWTEVKRETALDFDRNVSQVDKRKKPEDKRPDTAAEKPAVVTKDDDRPTPVTPTAPQPAGGATVTQTGADAEEHDGDGGAENEDEDDEDALKTRKKSVASAPPADYAEGISLSGSASGELTVAQKSVLGRGFRASLGLGGGLVFQDQTRAPAIALNLRIEAGRGRSLLGVEGSLWLVDGLHGQGRVLASFARVGVARWFEIGIGAGLHFGAGIGPAGAAALRFHLPPAPWAAAYLRYDGALLVQPDGSRQGQNTATGGLEWGF